MNQVQRFLVKYYRQIETPLAMTAVKLAEQGEWTKLQELRSRHPTTFATALDYKREVMVTEIFRKCLLPGDTQRRKEAAISAFWSSEHQCKLTNDRLKRYHPNHHLLRDDKDVAVDDFIIAWRKEIKSVLGKAPYCLEPSFSGGSTLSDSGSLTTIPDKMSSEPTVYTAGVSFFHDYFRFTPQHEYWGYAKVVRGNRFFTVPKDSDKDRGCGLEASVNMSLQLSVGKHMKRRFAHVYRYRLQGAQCRHRRLARLASAGRRALATIDLSNASDTVARWLVELVLPQDWLQLLNSLRATHTDVDGRLVRLEKFSSMGNGFTFELETILFKTLCDVIIGSRSSYAFGDDLIVPMDRAAEIISALRFFGFTPNEKKTFCEGPFRESCGGDYFEGTPVRAHYLKELPDEPQDWIALANGLRRVDPKGTFSSSSWRYCVDQLPRAIAQCRGPSRLGDIVLHDDFAEPTMRTYTSEFWDRNLRKHKKYVHSPTMFYRVYRPVGAEIQVDKHFSYRVATAAGALGVPSRVAPRDSISGYKLDWVPAWGRADLWDWVE